MIDQWPQIYNKSWSNPHRSSVGGSFVKPWMCACSVLSQARSSHTDMIKNWRSGQGDWQVLSGPDRPVRSGWSCNFYFFSWSLFSFPSNKSNSSKLLRVLSEIKGTILTGRNGCGWRIFGDDHGFHFSMTFWIWRRYYSRCVHAISKQISCSCTHYCPMKKHAMIQQTEEQHPPAKNGVAWIAE